VTERTEELQRAMTELETISYSISHELRSPLRAIDGFSLIALEEGREVLSPATVEGLERSRKAAQHMGHLIDDLLDVLKLHATELTLESVDVSALTTRLVAEQPAEKPVRSVVQPGMAAEADPELLEVLLRNLVSNAVKFSSREPSPRVEVWAEQSGDTTRFCVRDNGIGLEMEQAGDLFRPFVRLVGQQEFEGTGIGLAIVQRIAALHGGRAGLDGAPGEGATAWFTLAPDA
jgi:signal transduction histidine kinase